MVPWTAFWCSATNMEYLSLNPDQSFTMSVFLLYPLNSTCHPLNITQFNLWKLCSGRTRVSKKPNPAPLCVNKILLGDFPGGPVVKNPPFNAEDSV